MIRRSSARVMSRPSALPVRSSMPPMASDIVDLGLREIVARLVGGDAVFVEAAGLFARVEDGHGMAVHGETVGAGKARRARADDGDLLAGRRGARS